jgi:hypothetical protein
VTVHSGLLPDRDIMDILSTKAPKEHNEALVIEQGSNPEASTVEEFVEISERAETKENVCQERKCFFNSNVDSSSEDQRRSKKKQKPSKARNHQSNSDRKEFCCKERALTPPTIPPTMRSSMASKLTSRPGSPRTNR